MIWFDRSTYVFRVIVVTSVGSHPLTYIVATKHASGRLPRALEVGDMQKTNNTVKHIVPHNQYSRYLSLKMVIPMDVERQSSYPSSLGHAGHHFLRNICWHCLMNKIVTFTWKIMG